MANEKWSEQLRSSVVDDKVWICAISGESNDYINNIISTNAFSLSGHTHNSENDSRYLKITGGTVNGTVLISNYYTGIHSPYFDTIPCLRVFSRNDDTRTLISSFGKAESLSGPFHDNFKIYGDGAISAIETRTNSLYSDTIEVGNTIDGKGYLIKNEYETISKLNAISSVPLIITNSSQETDAFSFYNENSGKSNGIYVECNGGIPLSLYTTGNTIAYFAGPSNKKVEILKNGSINVGGSIISTGATIGTILTSGSTTTSIINASNANLGTTKITGNLTATGVTITTDNIIGKYASFNTVDDNGDPSLRATSNDGIAFISNTTGPLGNFLTSTTGTTLMTRAISGNAIYAYSSSGDPLKVYTKTGSYIAKFGTSSFNGTPNDRLTIANDGSIMTKGSVQINDSLNVNDDITATGETSTIKGTIGNFNIININTNGTSALFSTYNGINSNGYNIFIGGGGQNSYGEQSIPSRGSYNTSLGLLAFQSNELGWRNTSIGYQSLYNNITGSSNTAIGSESLYNNTIGSQNVAIGSSSLESNTIGLLNTAIGYNSLSENTTGYYNCAIGAYSLFKNVNGKWNVALGYNSSFNNISGVHNVSIGNDSLVSNIGGHVNISIGDSSLYSLTGGSNNIAIGSYAGANIGYDDQYSNTYSSDSIFLGSQSAPLNTGETNQIVIGVNSVGNGSNSVTIGNDSINSTILKGTVTCKNINLNTNGNYTLFSSYKGVNSNGYNIFIGGGGQNSIGSVEDQSLGSFNTSYGTASLYYNTTGYQNTSVGYNSLNKNNTGYNNTANGTSSIFYNTSGYNNTANGVESIYSNTTGYNNTANGVKSIYSNTTGYDNTANGIESLKSNTIGYRNTAIGARSLFNNINGYYNTAIGTHSLSGNTSGSQNTSIGFGSLEKNDIGVSNTAVGGLSLNLNINGNYNTAVGESSLGRNVSGLYNTAIGYGSLSYNSTGHYNIVLGGDSGNLDSLGNLNTVINNSILIGYDARPLSNNQTNQIVIGSTAIGHGSNTVTIGNHEMIDTYIYGTVHAPKFVVSGVTIDNVSGGTVNVTRLKFNSEKAITSSDSPGQDGEFYVDRYYIYVYFGNAWRRAALSEWT